MIYLDNAATSRFKPLKSVLIQLFFLLKSANPGRSAHRDAIKAAMAVEKTRDFLSQNHCGMRVVFTKNCTEAICLAVRGLHLKGVALTSPYEHNAVLRTLDRETKNGLRLEFIRPSPTGVITEKEVEAALTADTRLVVLGKMNNVTGQTIDEVAIGKLLRKKGILFLLDGAQSSGHVAVDERYVDLLATSGHKGLHGPTGTGYLAFWEHLALEPLLTGGTGSSTMSLKHPDNYPDAYEAGTQSAASIAALGAAAQWTQKNFAKLGKKTHKLSAKLYDGLANIAGVRLLSVRGASTVSFTLGGMPSTEVAAKLCEQYGIAVRAGLHCAPLTHQKLKTLDMGGAVRASIGHNNCMRHIKQTIRAVQKIAKVQTAGKHQ